MLARQSNSFYSLFRTLRMTLLLELSLNTARLALILASALFLHMARRADE